LNAAALATWLAQLPNPAGVVFDESHFGGFTENYLNRRYFFDIHPPLGKLTMSLYAHLRGYKPNVCDYTRCVRACKGHRLDAAHHRCVRRVCAHRSLSPSSPSPACRGDVTGRGGAVGRLQQHDVPRGV
jgi:hypothetical protein